MHSSIGLSRTEAPNSRAEDDADETTCPRAVLNDAKFIVQTQAWNQAQAPLRHVSHYCPAAKIP